MSKADTLLKKATAFEKLAIYSDRKSFLQALSQDATAQTFAPVGPTEYQPGTAPPVHQEPESGPAFTGWKQLNAPAVREQGGVTKTPNYGDPTTVNTLQMFLNNALRSEIIAGQRSPLVVDSKFGPDTAKALQMWGQKHNIQAKSLSDLVNIALQQSK